MTIKTKKEEGKKNQSVKRKASKSSSLLALLSSANDNIPDQRILASFYISFSYLIFLRRKAGGTAFKSDQCFFQHWAGAPSIISTDFRRGQACLAREVPVRTELNRQETLWKEGEIST